MNDHWSGTGYFGPQEELIIRTAIKKTQDNEIAQLRQRWQPSDVFAGTDQFALSIANYTHIEIRSFDLAGRPENSSTLVRLANDSTRERSQDYKINLRPNNFSALGSNLDYVRECVDFDYRLLDFYRYGGLSRLAGSTADRCVGIFLPKLGRRIMPGWLSLGDQLFLPLENLWQETQSTLNYRGSISRLLNIQEAVEYQRLRGCPV